MAVSTHNHPTRFWEMGIVAAAGYVGNGSGASQEEAEANGALMAAAPEMLAALQRARQGIANLIEMRIIPEQYRDTARDELLDIDAALAKATGVQP